MHCEFSEARGEGFHRRPQGRVEAAGGSVHKSQEADGPVTISRPKKETAVKETAVKETTVPGKETTVAGKEAIRGLPLDLSVKKCHEGMKGEDFLRLVSEKTDFGEYLSRVLSFLDLDIRDYMLLPQFRRIWERVFTHASVIGDPTKNYELPETIGDAFVNANFKVLLLEKFPSITESQMTSLSNHYMSAAFQPKLARSLGMHNHVNVSDSYRHEVGGDIGKILEDVFEAFCGALAIISRTAQVTVKEDPTDMTAVRIALKIGINPPVKSLLTVCFSIVEPIDFKYAEPPAKNQINDIVRNVFRSQKMDIPKGDFVLSQHGSVFLRSEAADILRSVGFTGITRVDKSQWDTASCMEILDSIKGCANMHPFLKRRPRERMGDLGFTDITEAPMGRENQISIITARFKGNYIRLLNKKVTKGETKESRMAEALAEAEKIAASRR